MKLDEIINHGEGPSFPFLTEQRKDEIRKFVDNLFEQDITKGMAMEKCILFANSTVEAVLVYSWFEARLMEETMQARGLISALKTAFSK